MKITHRLARAMAVAAASLLLIIALPAAAAADVAAPPVLDALYLEAPATAVGGSLIVSADAYSPDSQIESIWAEFVSPQTGAASAVYLGRNYNRGIDGLYSGQLTGLDTPGQYLLRVVVLTDRQGNRARYYGDPDFAPASARNACLWEQPATFQVQQDTLPPTVTDWRFSQRTEDDQRVVTIGLTARDDVSGVKSIQTIFEHTETGKRVYLALGKGNWVQGDDYQREWQAPQQLGGGRYRLVKYTVQDEAENKQSFALSPLKDELPLADNLSFVLSGGQVVDDTPPVLTQIAVKESQTFDSKLRYRLEVKALDDRSGVHHITLRFKNAAANRTLSQVLTPDHQTDSDIYSAWIEVDTTEPSGQYQLDSAVVTDNNGNTQLYYGKGATQVRNRLPLPQTPSLPVQTPYTATDTEPPALTALELESSAVTQGQRVQVTARASDNLTGVDSVRVVFENLEKTARIYLTLRDDGAAFTGSLDTARRSGVYTLAQVLVRDKAGNLARYSSGQGNLPQPLRITIQQSDGRSLY